MRQLSSSRSSTSYLIKGLSVLGLSRILLLLLNEANNIGFLGDTSASHAKPRRPPPPGLPPQPFTVSTRFAPKTALRSLSCHIHNLGSKRCKKGHLQTAPISHNPTILPQSLLTRPPTHSPSFPLACLLACLPVCFSNSNSFTATPVPGLSRFINMCAKHAPQSRHS
ncbi:hypothetical protein IWX49DRAFT_96469 [Phyllosticta citricarpa]|uniref:Uncharacterized protein n=1 Tax=Phyllosticta paracitricarpa TaxID=2016321 RepID=A0ABR1NDJ3_9PEZI